MPPVTLFFDMCAVAAGLVVNGLALLGVAAASLYALGSLRKRSPNETE